MKNTIIYIIIFSLICFCYLGFYIYRYEYRDSVLEIYFFSLKRGRAIFLRTPENKTILIGGGQNSEIIKEITKITPFYKRKIDVLFIPSSLPVQIGGLIDIVNRYEIGKIIMPKIMATSSVLFQLKDEIDKNKIPITEVEKGDYINIDKNLKINILFPYQGFKFNKTSIPDLGLKIEFNKTAIFLFGNLSKTIQKDISKNIEIKTEDNLIEYYNSATETRVFKDLINKIKPKYIFNTKEKSKHFVSDGENWEEK